MGNFFSSLFSSSRTKGEMSEEEKDKNGQKNFEILKYDGVRALQCCGKAAYGIKCLEEALNLREDIETMSFLASGYTMTMQLDKALEVTSRMMELAPERVELRVSRINLLFMMDRDAEVPADCEAIIALEPENYLAYYLMAKAKKTTENQLGAIADLTKSIALKDDFAGSYMVRADILYHLGQGKEALADVDKAIELMPEEENGYLLRGEIYALLGQMQEAAADFDQVIELNPFNEEAMLLKGRLLIAEGKMDEAIAYFDELIESNPEMAKAYAERGRVKNIKGDKNGAFEDLKKSIELNPEGEEAQKFNGQHSNFDNLYNGGIF